MGKIKFVKIKGKDIAFIDETDIGDSSVFSPPIPFKIVVSDGPDISGVVYEARGNNALVQIDY